jgi:hypothetical protein
LTMVNSIAPKYSFCSHSPYAPLFAICAIFIYKTLCAPTKTELDVTPAFTLLSRIFLSLIVFQPSGGSAAVGWQRTNAARRFVDTYQHRCHLCSP